MNKTEQLAQEIAETLRRNREAIYAQINDEIRASQDQPPSTESN